MWPHIFQDLHARAHLTFVWVENVFLYLYLNVSIFNLFLQQKQEGNSQEKNLWTTFLTSVHVVFLNKMSFKKYFHRQFTEFIMSLLWVYYEFIMYLLRVYYEFIPKILHNLLANCRFTRSWPSGYSYYKRRTPRLCFLHRRRAEQTFWIHIFR